MARKRRLQPPESSSRPAAMEPAADSRSSAVPVTASLAAPVPPAGGWAMIVSGWVVVHLTLVASGYLAVVQPSGLQQRLLALAAPYLQGLHLTPEAGLADGISGDGVPLYLARGDGSERVLRMETLAAGAADPAGWQAVDGFIEDGSLRARRQQRYLTALAQLGINDQNALAARLILPMLDTAAATGATSPRETTASPREIRVVRLPNWMTNVVQDSEAAPYHAVLLETPEGRRLVRVAAARLTAAAGSATDADETPSSAAGGDAAAVTSDPSSATR